MAGSTGCACSSYFWRVLWSTLNLLIQIGMAVCLWFVATMRLFPEIFSTSISSLVIDIVLFIPALIPAARLPRKSAAWIIWLIPISILSDTIIYSAGALWVFVFEVNLMMRSSSGPSITFYATGIYSIIYFFLQPIVKALLIHSLHKQLEDCHLVPTQTYMQTLVGWNNPQGGATDRIKDRWIFSMAARIAAILVAAYAVIISLAMMIYSIALPLRIASFGYLKGAYVAVAIHAGFISLITWKPTKVICTPYLLVAPAALLGCGIAAAYESRSLVSRTSNIALAVLNFLFFAFYAAWFFSALRTRREIQIEFETQSAAGAHHGAVEGKGSIHDDHYTSSVEMNSHVHLDESHTEPQKSITAQV